MHTLTTLDWIIVFLYFCLIAGIVWWSSRRQKNPADYFLAGRHIGWFVVGCSLFASNIGSDHIVGLAGSGANSGMAMAHWEFHSWIMLMCAWVFVPFYYRSGVFTMPEFLEKRFNSKARWVLSVVSLVAYVFTKVSVNVYAGAVVFEALLPDTFGSPENAFWIGAFATVILTGVYTVMGGLRAVVYTEVAQTVLLLLGSIIITAVGLHYVGGWHEVIATIKPQAAHFAFWRPLSSPDFPWLGVIIAAPVIGIWYWCTDQYIVQRILAARDLKQARRGTIWGGFLKLSPVYIFLIPGLIGYVLHVKGIMQIPPNPGHPGEVMGDQVFALMVKNLLPIGIRGLVVAGLLAALMASLASLFNSCATLFTMDIYNKLWPGASEARQVRVGRMATVVVVMCGIIWIPIMKVITEGNSGLYQYIQDVQSFLAPPITAVFLLGLFLKRINSRGALTGLITGFVLGMVKLTIQFMVESGAIVGRGILYSIGRYNAFYFSGMLFLFIVALVVVVSLLTPPPPAAQISGLTYGSITPADRAASRASWNYVDVLVSAGVLALVVASYLYFSFWLS